MTQPPQPVILQNLSIPRPSSGNLAALAEKDRPIAVFSDFDGTIFFQDTGHVLFDKFGCGPEQRERLDKSIGKTMSFRAASEELWGSLNVTLPEAIAELKKKLTIDPDFYTFFEYLQAHDIPFTVISAGMKPLLRAALDEFLGKEKSAKIKIVSNDGEISEDGTVWKPIWRHDSELGHDKARSVQEFRDSVEGVQPKVVFLGDGVSDLAAASQADILFARRGLALEEYCIENMIPYIPYNRFKEIIVDVKKLVKGNKYHDPEAKEAARRAKIAQLTGLSPLTAAPGDKPASKGFSLGAASSDEEDEDEDSDVEAAAKPPAPQSPPHSPPLKPVVDERPGLDRKHSTGTVPVPAGKPAGKLAPFEEDDA